MPLTDTFIRSAKPGPKPQKLYDSNGLYLELAPSGGKWWRLKYRWSGREKRISLGTYPDVGLAQARKRRDEARGQLANGQDPGFERQRQKVEETQAIASTFESIAREWFGVRRDEWAPLYAQKIIERLERDIFPWLAQRDIREITAPELLLVIRKIEARGAIETAHRALENCNQIFRYAVATGRVQASPARDLKDALKKPLVRHFPAVTEPVRLGQLIRAMRGYQGTPVVRAALFLAPLLLLRPGELRNGTWDEIDLEAGVWQVPAARMKRELQGKLMGEPHVVPLAKQACAALKELRQYTGPTGFVFPGERHRDRVMSENTVNAALRAMGFGADEVTGHRFQRLERCWWSSLACRPPGKIASLNLDDDLSFGAP